MAACRVDFLHVARAIRSGTGNWLVDAFVRHLKYQMNPNDASPERDAMLSGMFLLNQVSTHHIPIAMADKEMVPMYLLRTYTPVTNQWCMLMSGCDCTIEIRPCMALRTLVFVQAGWRVWTILDSWTSLLNAFQSCFLKVSSTGRARHDCFGSPFNRVNASQKASQQQGPFLHGWILCFDAYLYTVYLTL